MPKGGGRLLELCKDAQREARPDGSEVYGFSTSSKEVMHVQIEMCGLPMLHLH